MMKVLYPYPVTTLPKTQGCYLVGNKLGHKWQVWFNPHDAEGQQWTDIGTGKIEGSIDFWYSDQPPPEIGNAVEEIKHAIDVRPKDGSEYNHIELTIESAQTLLQTLKAE